MIRDHISIVKCYNSDNNNSLIKPTSALCRSGGPVAGGQLPGGGVGGGSKVVGGAELYQEWGSGGGGMGGGYTGAAQTELHYNKGRRS